MHTPPDLRGCFTHKVISHANVRDNPKPAQLLYSSTCLHRSTCSHQHRSVESNSMAAPAVHERLAVHIGLAREVRAREAAVQRALQHRLAVDEGDGRVLFDRHPGGRLYLIRLRHQRALTWLGPAQPHAKSRRMRSRSGPQRIQPRVDRCHTLALQQTSAGRAQNRRPQLVLALGPSTAYVMREHNHRALQMQTGAARSC